MTVYFIGRDPQAPFGLSRRAQAVIARCPVYLHETGPSTQALPPLACPPSVQIVDVAGLSLDQIIGTMAVAHDAGKDVVRVGPGPSAPPEEVRGLDVLRIPHIQIPP